jgi:hypothetical protein
VTKSTLETKTLPQKGAEGTEAGMNDVEIARSVGEMLNPALKEATKQFAQIFEIWKSEIKPAVMKGGKGEFRLRDSRSHFRTPARR